MKIDKFFRLQEVIPYLYVFNVIYLFYQKSKQIIKGKKNIDIDKKQKEK